MAASLRTARYPAELEELAARGIELIDLVVVNVKPFAPEVGARSVPLDEAIEMIDVGGTALITRRGAQLRVGRGRLVARALRTARE